MSHFQQLKQQFLSKLYAQQFQFYHGFYALKVEIAVDKPFCLLEWLSAQAAFPQCFWQARDDDVEIAALGTLRTFDNVTEAEQFARTQQLMLVGGKQFDGSTRFILPRLCLQKNGGKLIACCYFEQGDVAMLSEFLNDAFSTAATVGAMPPLQAVHSVNDFAQWQQKIELALQAIRAQALRKVVLANAQTFSFNQPLSAYALLQKSRAKNLGCYHFLWADDAQSVFIGSSPERLYRREQNALFTEALAGTAAVVEDSAQTEENARWLLNDKKNIRENQLVVEDIYLQLQHIIDDFSVAPREIKRLHNVQHLRRRIQATLQAEHGDADCLSNLHPTAAIAGLPRAEAFDFIQQYEGFSRTWYAGALGYISGAQAEFTVTLRSAMIKGGDMTVFAGAGIVDGSDAQSEWQEIGRKSQAMIGLFAN